MSVRCIGLSGPDGAGKSSVARQLDSWLQGRGVPTRIVHLYGCPICRRWGRQRGTSSADGAAVPHTAASLHALVDLADLRARLALARLSLSMRQLAARSPEAAVLVTDRSPLDGLVKFLPKPGSVTERLYLAAAAQYEAIAVLDAPAGVLALRDREHDEGYLATKRTEFGKRGAALPNVVRIDTTQSSPAELAAAVWRMDQAEPRNS